MAQNQFAGIARVKVDGALLDTDGSTTLEIGGIMRETMTGDHSIGYKESNSPSKVEVNVHARGGASIASFRDVSDATISVEYDNGLAFLINHGWVAETITISDSKFKLVLQGPPAEQVS